MLTDLHEETDEVRVDRRRLAIAHLWLGGIASFTYWLRPTTIQPMVPGIGYGTGAIALATLLAWIPYFISWRITRVVLPGRGRGISVFIACATVITIGAASFYLNLFEKPQHVPAIFVSVGVGLLLAAAAGLCAIIWRQ